MQKGKKIGSAVLVALLSLSCTTKIESYLFAAVSKKKKEEGYKIRMWDISDDGKKARELRPLKGHEDYVASLTFSPDGHYLVSGDLSGKLNVWDVRSPEDVQKLQTLRSQ